MEHNPLISIIIPCYNQASFIEETLQSVYQQQYQNWECLLINDGSTDNSESIILDWVQRDKRFQYCKTTNLGVSAARNYGLRIAQGEYVQFLDGDDLLAADKLILSIDALQKYKVDIVCSNYLVFSAKVKVAEPPFSNLDHFEFNFYNLARYWNDGFTVPCHCWFFKASLFQNISFPQDLTAQEDWVMWLLIFQQKPKIFYLQKPLALYRRNPFGRTNAEGFFDETLLAIRYLKPFLKDSDFQLLYESALIRSNNSILYWRNRTDALKKSNTFQFGLLCKKVVKTVGLLVIAKKIFHSLQLNK
ncbi:glycosyltransferase family 2 protein [Flavobacterium sp. XS1P32]|uniref:glycosyltransferase family 2 protein n=1 Tax=Flavobacterium sp. XS1P32 TaxID=3401726 RepID=UPI003AAA8C03